MAWRVMLVEDRRPETTLAAVCCPRVIKDKLISYVSVGYLGVWAWA